MLVKNRIYPRPHQFKVSWEHNLTNALDSTIVPICHYDEGQGSPSSYNANPEHASFAEYGWSNCYPESVIGKKGFRATLTVSLTKHALETDKIHACRVAYSIYKVSFLNDLTAKDEVSGLDIEAILELQHDTTNREVYPLYNGNDMAEPYLNAGNTHADQAGLTTDTSLEEVDFSRNNYYDILQYGKLSPKLQAVQTGLRWITLTRNRPYREIPIFLKSKSKVMHEYSGLFAMLHVPKADTQEQLFPATDISTGGHVRAQLNVRFNEWNQRYNMERT